MLISLIFLLEGMGWWKIKKKMLKSMVCCQNKNKLETEVDRDLVECGLDK
jgi:hypothetical protein